MTLQDIKNGIKQAIEKYLVKIAVGLVIAIGGTGTFYLKKIYTLITHQDINTHSQIIKSTDVTKAIDEELIKCKTNGVFMGVWKIEIRDKNYFVQNEQLRGIWNNSPDPQDVRLLNPIYLKSYHLDGNELSTLLGAVERGEVLFVNYDIAKQNNYTVLKHIFENLDLKNEGHTLEGMYLYGETKDKLIWIFSLSFEKLTNNPCHSATHSILSEVPVRELGKKTTDIYKV